MAFNPAAATDLTVVPMGEDVRVSWTPNAPPGTVYQLYAAGRHAYTGFATSVILPRPHEPTWYVAGSIDPGEWASDLSGSIPAAPGGGGKIKLAWPGGTYLKANIAGFRVYRGLTPGGAVSYVTPVGSVAAYSQGSVTDGYGFGGFNQGSFGHSESWYSWTSEILSSGVWFFGVVPFDAAGNPGSPLETSSTVTGPPSPIPRGPSGKRVAYTVSRGTSGGYNTGEWNSGGYAGAGAYGIGGWNDGGFNTGAGEGASFATLSWLASPG